MPSRDRDKRKAWNFKWKVSWLSLWEALQTGCPRHVCLLIYWVRISRILYIGSPSLIFDMPCESWPKELVACEHSRWLLDISPNLRRRGSPPWVTWPTLPGVMGWRSTSTECPGTAQLPIGQDLLHRLPGWPEHGSTKTKEALWVDQLRIQNINMVDSVETWKLESSFYMAETTKELLKMG